MTTMQQTSAEQDQIRPVQFLTTGELEQLPVPLIRITTCGLLTVELVAEIVSSDPPLARYVPLTSEELRGRGTVPAFTLLKLLLNRHERFASHEWLMEQFCCEGELFSSKRINNIVSQLRNLLCSSALPVLQALRMQIVAHVRSSGSSGYQLAASPLVWVDQDALAWNVEQATRMERFSDTALALPFWERAYEIARRGPYLPDEIYTDWSRRQRGEVEGALRQSVQALARLYQEQHGATGEEEALRLLRSYWLEHPHEEDVLRILMELLGKRECTHEALEYYEQLCTILKEDEREPDSQTQDVAQYLRNKQIQRPSQVITRLSEDVIPLTSSFPTPTDENHTILSTSSFHFHRETSEFPQRMISSNETNYTPYSPTETLERLSRALAKPSAFDEATLLSLEQRVQSCWRFRPDILGIISPDVLQIVLEYLQQVSDFLGGALSPCYRLRLCALACELTQIAGWTLYEMRSFSQAQAYYELALTAAREAENPLLEAVTLVRMSRLFKYCAQEERILPALQYARQLLGDTEMSPTLSWIRAEEALAYAREGRTYESLKALEHVTHVMAQGDRESDPYWIGFEENVRLGFFGSCYTELRQFDKAEIAYREALQQITISSCINPKHRCSLLSVNLATILVRQGAVDEACKLSNEAISLVQQSQSPLVLQHLFKFRRELEPWNMLTTVEVFNQTLAHVQTSFAGKRLDTHQERRLSL